MNGIDLTLLAAAEAPTGVSLMWLVVAIPLASAAILLLAGRAADAWGHILGVAASAAAFVVAAWAFFAMLGRAPAERSFNLGLFDWITGGDFNLQAGLRIDQLSISFVLLVTFVGTLIHIYSVAYMSHDPDRRRFFAYLNLFVAAMLLLVLGNSYLVLFVGWEGVGLASYLLIGFWNQRLDYAVAAKKAFVANRVGDVGMLIAMMVMFAHFHTLTFDGVFEQVQADTASTAVLTAIGLALLLAACGKSAQFPLQSWLGDAMAGPTPVSALIHAATMVTAGVYLVVRSGPIYIHTEGARLAVLIVGAITLLYGAIVGCAKDDMKKALAASTMSQIGYMMLAAGLGPVGAAFAIMHLLTHGFFKAGLFLGAGSVMHAMKDQVDMRRFGGLGTVMKLTWVTMMAGWLAILGIPPFSGFWSKDKIIEEAFVGTGWQPWVFGLVAMLGAGITAFYMSRLFFMVFHGQARWTDDQHPHEAPPLMTVPMAILAIGSVALGGILSLIGFAKWLEPVTQAAGEAAEAEPVLAVPVITVATLVLVLAGAALAWVKFGAKTAQVPVLPPPANVLVKAAREDLFQDTANDVFLVRPGQAVVKGLTAVDGKVVDGAVRGIGCLVQTVGGGLSRWQTGFVRSYAASMLAGVILLAAIVLAVWL